jgi:GTP cyclohydrolase I
MDLKKNTWAHNLEIGIEGMLQSIVAAKGVNKQHVLNTPERFLKASQELFAGVSADPKKALNTLFDSDCDEMICIKEIKFFSTCAHHLIPFFGKMTFAYIPDGKIVGLSKIPRLVEVYARRPQVQEDLTSNIVEAFQNIVKPKGCGLMIRAYHLCCMARGIKQPTSYTETTALRGIFKQQASTKAEFISAANASNWNVF